MMHAHTAVAWAEALGFFNQCLTVPVSPLQGEKSSPLHEEASVGPRSSELLDRDMHLFSMNVRDCVGLFSLTMAVG